MKYLAEIIDETREQEAIRREFMTATGNVSQCLSDLFLHPRQLIRGIRIPYYYFDDSLTDNDGDIDVLLIPYYFLSPDKYQLICPDYRYLVGLEVKVPYLSKESGDLLKGGGLGSYHDNQWKPGGKIKNHIKQARKIVDSGFDRAALLYLVPASPRDNVEGIRAFTAAAEISRKGQTEVVRHLQEALKREDIIKAEDRFGIIVQGIGAVAGAIESYKGGSPFPEVLKEASYNTDRPEFRIKLEKRLRTVIPDEFVPEIYPPIIRACSNSKCRALVLWHPRNGDVCLECRSELR